jgi:peptidoglycan biosynthesis protein MviN/MurJ (putative lipid II flippase)
LFSRVLGMVREIVYARFMGDGWVRRVSVRVQIPNLFRRLLGEGALTAAFIPIFKERKNRTAKSKCGARPTPSFPASSSRRAVIIASSMLGISLALAVPSFRR